MLGFAGGSLLDMVEGQELFLRLYFTLAMIKHSFVLFIFFYKKEVSCVYSLSIFRFTPNYMLGTHIRCPIEGSD